MLASDCRWVTTHTRAQAPCIANVIPQMTNATPVTRASQWPSGMVFSSNTKTAMPTIQYRFITPPKNSNAVLKIDGKKVTKVGEVEVRGLPEGAVFSPDGRWLYVGNFLDSDLSVLRVDGDTVTNTGTLVKLPGKPASMRGRTL